MKKAVVLFAALMLTFSGAALAAEKVEGKVKSVSGDTVTIEVKKSEAGKLSVGSEVEMEVKAKKEGKKAPAKGMDMLQGC
jgi:uncharacterized OB-fold protein